MRRVTANLSYHRETNDIIQAQFKDWQLTYRDARDGVHRMTNTVVGLSQEAESEMRYVRDMFMPSTMRLSEEWVLYRTNHVATADGLYIDGVSVDTTLPLAGSIDEMIDGTFDQVILEKQMGTGNSFTALAALSSMEIYGLTETGSVYNILPDSDEVSLIESIDPIEVADTFVADSINRVYRITEEIISGTISAQNDTGTVPITVLEQNSNMAYNTIYDLDGDGIIWNSDIALINSYRGVSQSDVTPTEWADISVLDINGNGVFDDDDYAMAVYHFNTLADGVYAAVEVSTSITGIVTITYQPKQDRPIGIKSNNDGYAILYGDDIMTSFGSIVAYDPELDIHYVTTGSSQQIKALRRLSDGSIISDVMIGIPANHHSENITGLAVSNGILIAVTSGDTGSYIYFGDTLIEYVDVLDYSIPLPSGVTPDAMTFSPDDRLIITAGENLYIYKPGRNRYIVIDEQVYLNQRHTILDASDESVVLIPSYVFNSFDAFAYNLGMSRPWGSDNLAMRRMIFDFFEHTHGHTKSGMEYGIARELGYVNQTIAGTMTYMLSNPIDTEDAIYINGKYLQRTSEDDAEPSVYTSEYGTVTIFEKKGILLPASIIESENISSITVTGSFEAENGQLHSIDEEIIIETGVTDHPVVVNSLGNIEYLIEKGYLTTGDLPTDEFRQIVEAYDYAHPSTYRNIVFNENGIDTERIPYRHFCPNTFNASQDENVTSETDEDIDL